MRVGIITMISDNYGNRLQNYALQEVLTEIGNEVETLNNPWQDKYSPFCKKMISSLKRLIYFITKRPQRYVRRIRFEYFNQQNITFSKLWLNRKSDRLKANKLYDIFICGSDQIWNSEAKEITGKYFADFADVNKRASYAASFGIDEIVPDRKEEFSHYLAGMRYISVREQAGVSILKELIGADVNCHLDPTLLLTAEKWNKMAAVSYESDDKYIFCYFLGRPLSGIMNEVERYGKANNLKVKIICEDVKSQYNNVGPDIFLSLIKNAEFVITDSFHGTIFSIIYERPFYTFNREGVKRGMASRVVSILNLLMLQDRFEPDKLVEQNIYSINFHKAAVVLKEERKKALDYLRKITKTSG